MTRATHALAATCALLVLAGCTGTTAGDPSASAAAAPSAPTAAAASGAGPAALHATPSGRTAAEIIAAMPKTLGGRPRSDNGTNPQEITVGGKPGTVHSYVYKGKAADDYVAVQVATTTEAALLFPAGVARLESPQPVAGVSCGVGRVDGRQMNVCYALLNDGVLTVAEPTGKLASLGRFTDKLARADV